MNLGPLEEEPMLLTTEPSLQPKLMVKKKKKSVVNVPKFMVNQMVGSLAPVTVAQVMRPQLLKTF